MLPKTPSHLATAHSSQVWYCTWSHDRTKLKMQTWACVRFIGERDCVRKWMVWFYKKLITYV